MRSAWSAHRSLGSVTLGRVPGVRPPPRRRNGLRRRRGALRRVGAEAIEPSPPACAGHAIPAGRGVASAGDALLEAACAEARASRAPRATWSSACAALPPAARQRALTRADPELRLPGGAACACSTRRSAPPAATTACRLLRPARRADDLPGRVALTLHCRPEPAVALQVTADLAGFWERHYPELRRALMRRNPRHDWPEDGARATPPAPRGRRGDAAPRGRRGARRAAARSPGQALPRRDARRPRRSRRPRSRGDLRRSASRNPGAAARGGGAGRGRRPIPHLALQPLEEREPLERGQAVDLQPRSVSSTSRAPRQGRGGANQLELGRRRAPGARRQRAAAAALTTRSPSSEASTARARARTLSGAGEAGHRDAIAAARRARHHAIEEHHVLADLARTHRVVAGMRARIGRDVSS
jgi:hypothetical protein